MDADLDLLCISVCCTADDLLPERKGNGRRRLTDAQIVTLRVAQAVMGIPSDRRFLRAARRQLGHLFPVLPSQGALHKRRARLAETIEWLIGVFAANSPGSTDDLLLLDSTPVECGRSVETARGSRLAEGCGYGYSRSHSRWFWGMPPSPLRPGRDATGGRPGRHRPCRARSRTDTLAAGACRRRDDRVPQGLRRTRARRPRQRTRRHHPAATTPQRAANRTTPGTDPATNRISLLDLQRPAQPRTPRRPHSPQPLRPHRRPPTRTRPACITLNHQLGRPSRAIADYTA